MVRKKIGIKLDPKQIDAAHPLPTRRKGGKGSTIVKLHERDTKALLMKNRKKLKGSGITIVEDLCVPMQKLLNRVNNHPMVKNAWAWQGNIFYEHRMTGEVSKAVYGEPLGLGMTGDPEEY